MPKPKKEKKEEKETKKLSKEEFEKEVLKLAEKGMTAEKIGEKLRHEGIHPKEYGKISRILKAKNLYQIPEIKNIQEKLSRIEEHIKKNIQDKRAMRERERIFSLLRRYKEYYKISQ